MNTLFYLSTEQLDHIKPYFSLSHWVPRVDERYIISEIIYVIKHGLQWKEAPRESVPYKVFYECFIRLTNPDIFNNIFAELFKQNGATIRLMVDATHSKIHRTAASLLKKGFPNRSRKKYTMYRARGGKTRTVGLVCPAQSVA